jgi:hypothetical protein
MLPRRCGGFTKATDKPKGPQRARKQHLDYASALARRLMNRHGLNKWSFAFIDDKGLLGQCQNRKRRIVLSAVHVPFMKRADIRDTILHEIAHALTPAKAPSHGTEWKANAVKLGANPEYRDAAPSGYQGAWEWKCSRCKQTGRRFSAPHAWEDLNCRMATRGGYSCGGNLQWRNVETGRRISYKQLKARSDEATDRQQAKYFLERKETRKNGIEKELRAGIRKFGKQWGERLKRGIALLTVPRYGKWLAQQEQAKKPKRIKMYNPATRRQHGMMTTEKLVKMFRERLGHLSQERKRIDGEIAELKAAFSAGGATVSKAIRRTVKKAKAKAKSGKGPSAAARKKMAAARKAIWAEVHKLGLKSLAELKAHKAKRK